MGQEKAKDAADDPLPKQIESQTARSLFVCLFYFSQLVSDTKNAYKYVTIAKLFSVKLRIIQDMGGVHVYIIGLRQYSQAKLKTMEKLSNVQWVERHFLGFFRKSFLRASIWFNQSSFQNPFFQLLFELRQH